MNVIRHEHKCEDGEVELNCSLIDSFGEDLTDPFINKIRFLVIGGKGEIVRLSWCISRLAPLVFD